MDEEEANCTCFNNWYPISGRGSVSQKSQPVNYYIHNSYFLHIHELKQKAPSSGIFATEGYVVKVYICSPCPQGAACKPCMRNNIVISEENSSLETYSLSGKELIIFIDDPQKFVLEKKYSFEVEMSDQNSTGGTMNDIKLIRYQGISPEK